MKTQKQKQNSQLHLFALIFSVRGIWVFLPVIVSMAITLLIFDYTHDRDLGFAEKDMYLFNFPFAQLTWNYFLSTGFHRIIAQLLSILITLAFFYRFKSFKLQSDKILLICGLILSIHSLFHLETLYSYALYLGLFAAIWMQRKKICEEYAEDLSFQLLLFSTAFTFLASFILRNALLRPLFFTQEAGRIEEVIRPSLANSTYSTALLSLLLLSLICFRQQKKIHKAEPDNLLGKGRSANVFKIKDDKRIIARKLFTGTDLTNLILTFFYGAPVDYQWNPSAIKAAYHRRKVLQGLLKYWFPTELSIADAYNTGEDKESGMQYLDTEFIDGRPATLHTPFHNEASKEYPELKQKILPALQKKLKESGMIGTVWQAGYGQPCAIANFLYRNAPQEKQSKWVWIDAESGVPAIVCINPFKLFGYYIPMAIKQGKVMFDDLDIPSFEQYLKKHEKEIQQVLRENASEFLEHSNQLIKNADQWQSETRTSRGLKYFLFKGKINEEEMAYYQKHKLRWYTFLISDFIKEKLPKILIHTAEKVCSYGSKLNPFRYLHFTWKSISSRNYRIQSSQNLVNTKIDEWTSLGRISKDESKELKYELQNTETQQYLSDFGVFLLFKPLGYLIRISLPFLIAIDILNQWQAAFIFAFISIILRTSYSLYRLIEDVLRGHGCPWIALLISPFPMIGTLAHPCQMIHTARKGHKTSTFIIYEIFSTIAKKVPIYGGYNAELEYKCNNIAFKMVRISS